MTSPWGMAARWVLAIALFVALLSSTAAWLLFPSLGLAQVALGFLIQVAATVVMVRWQSPVGPILMVLAVTVTLVYAPIGWRIAFESDVTAWVPVMSAYATARLVADVRRRAELVLGVVLVAAQVLLLASPPWLMPGAPGPQPTTLLGMFGAASPPLAGACLALWARLRSARRDRIAALARERELVARQRVADERSRMAAELHDLVTHQMVRVIFQARNLARPGRADDVRRAADEIAETATTALEQMRDFLRAVRVEEDPWQHDDGAAPVGHTTRQIEEVVLAGRDLGQHITLDLPPEPGTEPGTGSDAGPGAGLDAVPDAGQDAGPGAGLSDAAGRCLVRAVQEGLVNAAKHAPGTPVTVRLELEPGHCAVVVENPLVPGADGQADLGGPDGPGGQHGQDRQTDSLARSGSGTGLLGITRRAEMLGGELTTGSDGDRFRLRVTVPLHAVGMAPTSGATAGSTP